MRLDLCDRPSVHLRMHGSFSDYVFSDSQFVIDTMEVSNQGWKRGQLKVTLISTGFVVNEFVCSQSL